MARAVLVLVPAVAAGFGFAVFALLQRGPAVHYPPVFPWLVAGAATALALVAAGVAALGGEARRGALALGTVAGAAGVVLVWAAVRFTVSIAAAGPDGPAEPVGRTALEAVVALVVAGVLLAVADPGPGRVRHALLGLAELAAGSLLLVATGLALGRPRALLPFHGSLPGTAWVLAVVLGAAAALIAGTAAARALARPGNVS